MFRQLELYIGGALLLIVLALSGFAYWQHSTIKRIEDENKTLTADSSSDRAAITGTRKLQRQEKVIDEALDKALGSNPEWAGQPVPDDVADLMRDRPLAE